MHELSWLAVGCALVGLVAGCGGGSSSGTDAGMMMVDAGQGGDAGDAGPTPISCPSSAPNVDQMMGPCCYLASNAGNTDMPGFRIAGLKLSAPPSLSGNLIGGAIQGYIDSELFNWLIQVQGASADGTVMVKTGYGQLNASDNSFSFCATGVGAPCDPTKWAPVTWNAMLASDAVTSGPAPSTVTLPIFDAADPTTAAIELPLYSLQIDMAQMSEMRSCIGTRHGSKFDTTQAGITTYITVADAMTGHVTIAPAVDSSLCGLVAGMAASDGSDPCATVDQSTWQVKPDSMCDTSSGVCTTGSCDPATTCNAWQVKGGIAAQGVMIH